MELRTGLLMSEVAAEVLPRHAIGVLSGPSFADELAVGSPTAVTIAMADEEAGAAIAEQLSSRTFRPYTTRDIVGTQIGGAMKNVIAIAAGIARGLGLGENAHASLVTRGLAEMTRLGLAKGAEIETLMGLSGIGDLLLTCGSPKSRNTSLGMEIAKGRTVEEIVAERKSVAEGVSTAKAVVDVAAQLDVDVPISRGVHAVLTHGISPRDVLEQLLSRALRAEGVSAARG
jgi:glycerol-3-phosphate dehydrogenase (NAD(P)+)